jgi:hypothetical protein
MYSREFVLCCCSYLNSESEKQIHLCRTIGLSDYNYASAKITMKTCSCVAWLISDRVTTFLRYQLAVINVIVTSFFINILKSILWSNHVDNYRKIHSQKIFFPCRRILTPSSIHIHDLFLYKNTKKVYNRGIWYLLKTFKITGTVNNICKIFNKKACIAIFIHLSDRNVVFNKSMIIHKQLLCIF